jgi:hypothetical protein
VDVKVVMYNFEWVVVVRGRPDTALLMKALVPLSIGIRKVEPDNKH